MLVQAAHLTLTSHPLSIPKPAHVAGTGALMKQTAASCSSPPSPTPGQLPTWRGQEVGAASFHHRGLVPCPPPSGSGCTLLWEHPLPGGTCTRTQAPAPVLEITGVGAPSFVPLLQVCTVVTGALPSLPWLYLLDFSYLWAGLCLVLHFYST